MSETLGDGAIDGQLPPPPSAPVHQVLRGLQAGVSRFTAPCRVALLLRAEGDPRLWVHDEQGLLGESPRTWAEEEGGPPRCLVYTGGSPRLPWSRWFVEVHPQFRCQEILRGWISYAATLLGLELTRSSEDDADINLDRLVDFHTRTAVGTYLTELSGTQPEALALVDLALRLHPRTEEGASASGRVAMVAEDVSDLLSLELAPSTAPTLGRAKHVRKLLQMVQDTDDHLMVCSRDRVLGVGPRAAFEGRLQAAFQDGACDLWVGPSMAASVRHGTLRAPERPWPVQALLRPLLSEMSDALLGQIEEVAARVQRAGHGALIVIHRDPAADVTGQSLARPISAEAPELAPLLSSLSRIDGALSLDHRGHLTSFGCLLDGAIVLGEDPARGARYCAALRYTTARPEAVAVVISEDGPVTVIQGGREIGPATDWPPLDELAAPLRRA